MDTLHGSHSLSLMASNSCYATSSSSRSKTRRNRHLYSSTLTMRHASAFLTRDKLIFCSSAKTIDGVYISTPPYVHMQRTAHASEIAKAIHQVLESSKDNVPHPNQKEWGEVARKHLDGLGMKSMSVLHAKANYCSMEELDGQLKFSPTKNLGTRGGYQFLADTYLTVSIEAPPEEITETLMEALEVSMQLSQ